VDVGRELVRTTRLDVLFSCSKFIIYLFIHTSSTFDESWRVLSLQFDVLILGHAESRVPCSFIAYGTTCNILRESFASNGKQSQSLSHTLPILLRYSALLYSFSSTVLPSVYVIRPLYLHTLLDSVLVLHLRTSKCLLKTQ
jgi:hypothetical protein